MIEIDIPGHRKYKIENLVLDLNGTVTLDGKLIDGVMDRINVLRKNVAIKLVTADTLGSASTIAAILGVDLFTVDRGDEQTQKLELVQHLGAAETVSIGNGSNDSYMLKESCIGICVMGSEGVSFEALINCDVLMTDIATALDLFIKPERLVATLRK
jgi:soluble P-type ATPase